MRKREVVYTAVGTSTGSVTVSGKVMIGPVAGAGTELTISADEAARILAKISAMRGVDDDLRPDVIVGGVS